MIWKIIGQSVTGSSHVQVNKACEDALKYNTVTTPDDEEILLCCASDGAGSARYASWASVYVTSHAITILTEWIESGKKIIDADIYELAEHLYDGLNYEASLSGAPLYEYSCTFLGFIIYKDRAAFFQIGDGVIVRNDGSGYFTYLWWPANGEYLNTTSFIVDDKHFGNLKVVTVTEAITEVGLITDGLQMLALNTEKMQVHQPFFGDLFKWLRMANHNMQVQQLDNRLKDYLDSALINERTDDDKTLFIASRKMPTEI